MKKLPSGIKPKPRTWMEWNLAALEPAHVKIREEIMNQAKNADKKSKCKLNNKWIPGKGASNKTYGFHNPYTVRIWVGGWVRIIRS